MNGKSRWPVLLIFLAMTTAIRLARAAPVEGREEIIAIPTYLLGAPDPNPIFYDGRGSQGAQGRVYPYPLYDDLTHVKSNKLYRIVYLENEYVRIGVLPEIGGRLFEAIDKSNGYNFVYRQHVIKPALIGLLGAWISGGIEWNIPHHHRATSALPVQYRLVDNADGSKTVWVGELEVRQRMRWAVGYTLRPGRSYLECSVRILNRTAVVNTMLCFANVAVHVNDDYQVIYPPHTRFVTFHGKHEFTTWPIATTRYAGADFTQGVDVSWYTNHSTANSMFAWNYQDDFFAGYDHGKQAGIMSVADHHLVPGKKFWTWGNGARGRMWDKILTDSDGPYIELMVGAYSDNQPDYSWLQPYETKSFKMYWYPFRQIDGVKNANLDAAVNLRLDQRHNALLGFCTTREYASATATLRAGTRVLFTDTFSIGPGKPYTNQVALPADLREEQLNVSLQADGKELVEYSPIRLVPQPLPTPVADPPPPAELKTVEELYLAGQRLEQFHSSSPPEPYWEEALRRDPGDARVNTALGIRLLKQARFGEAELHLRTAVARLSRNYTAPRDGEALYYLALALQRRAQTEECPTNIVEQAADAFFKATWSQAWRGPAWFALAQLASQRGDPDSALADLDRSLEANLPNIRALNLKAALLRHGGQAEPAGRVLELVERTTDPLDVRLLAERWLAGDPAAKQELISVLDEFPNTGLETAVEYADDGLWKDGVSLLELMIRAAGEKTSPMVYYYLAHFQEHLGQRDKVAGARMLALKASPEYVFPFQWEAIGALRQAAQANPQDPRARYFLGNLLFDWQPVQAARLWEQSVRLDPSFAIVHRNLALAYAKLETPDSTTQAIAQLEQAVAAPVKYARHFAELDELYTRARTAPSRRLEVLEKNQGVVSRRDDALSREIGLLVLAGRYDQAIAMMASRRFSVWEGGTLEVAQHWVNAHLLRARQRLGGDRPTEALADLDAAQTVPENLPNDGDNSGRASEIAYWRGEGYSRMGDQQKARAAWEQAATSAEHRSSAAHGLGEQEVQIYFGALALGKLGRKRDAEATFRWLLAQANSRLEAPAESPRGRPHRRPNVALAHLLAGLAHAGLGAQEQATEQYRLALEVQPDLLAAKIALAGAP